jgi:hypothetical protein
MAFSDGTWALLPLTVRNLGGGLLPIPQAMAGELGVYSGFVSPEPLSPEAEALAYAAIRRRYPDLWVLGNPFARSPLTAMADAVAREKTNHVLELRPFPELRAGFTHGCKGRGKKARKAGLTVRISSDPADAAVYYAMYRASMRRWGDKLKYARPQAFYEHLMAEGGGNVRLFIAYQGDRPVSAVLNATHGEVTYGIAAATETDALPLAPSTFLIEEALAHAVAQGLRWYDFGPSAGLEGVAQFKESFGATPRTFIDQRAQTLTGRLYSAVRQPLQRYLDRACAGLGASSPAPRDTQPA